MTHPEILPSKERPTSFGKQRLNIYLLRNKAQDKEIPRRVVTNNLTNPDTLDALTTLQLAWPLGTHPN